jgi:hypothetical protein
LIDAPAGGEESVIMVANTHLFWSPEFADVKLLQIFYFFRSIQRALHHYSSLPFSTLLSNSELPLSTSQYGDDLYAPRGPFSIPLIVAGDFNSKPNTGIYSFITRGTLPLQSPSSSSLMTSTTLESLNLPAFFPPLPVDPTFRVYRSMPVSDAHTPIGANHLAAAAATPTDSSITQSAETSNTPTVEAAPYVSGLYNHRRVTAEAVPKHKIAKKTKGVAALPSTNDTDHVDNSATSTDTTTTKKKKPSAREQLLSRVGLRSTSPSASSSSPAASSVSSNTGNDDSNIISASAANDKKVAAKSRGNSKAKTDVAPKKIDNKKKEGGGAAKKESKSTGKDSNTSDGKSVKEKKKSDNKDSDSSSDEEEDDGEHWGDTTTNGSGSTTEGEDDLRAILQMTVNRSPSSRILLDYDLFKLSTWLR